MTPELAKLRGERDALLDAVQANMLRPDYLRAERAEAERDRLAAELAAANAREAGLREALRHYMDLAHSGGTEADWHEAHDGATAAMEGCSK